MKKSVHLVIACTLISLCLGLGSILSKNTPTLAQLLIVADESAPMEVMADALRKHGPYHVKYVRQNELQSNLSTYHAVFMYIHGKMQPKTESILIEYATAGGRLIILHHGIASARVNNPQWLKLTGIYLAPRNDRERPWKVISNTTHTIVNLQPGHYITSNNIEYDRRIEYQSSDYPSVAKKYPAIDLLDTEVFLNQQFTDGREKTILLGFHCIDPKTKKVYMQDRCGWYKKANEGWVFYLQPGHKATDFRNEAYMQIILNMLTWTP